jgi:hypothetical protein
MKILFSVFNTLHPSLFWGRVGDGALVNIAGTLFWPYSFSLISKPNDLLPFFLKFSNLLCIILGYLLVVFTVFFMIFIPS